MLDLFLLSIKLKKEKEKKKNQIKENWNIIEGLEL